MVKEMLERKEDLTLRTLMLWTLSQWMRDIFGIESVIISSAVLVTRKAEKTIPASVTQARPRQGRGDRRGKGMEAGNRTERGAGQQDTAAVLRALGGAGAEARQAGQ